MSHSADFQPFNLKGGKIKSILITLLGVMILAYTQEASALKRDYNAHPGYLSAVERERETESRDFVLIHPPLPNRPNLNQRLFNDKLIKEFRDRYEEKFGRTEAEEIYNSPNRFSYFNDLYGFRGTPQELNDEKRRYGEFVLRRLLEHHIDEYAKNDPKVRPVWETKERLKEMRVEVASFRFDVQYSIAGNVLDVKLQNPYASLTRVRVQMDAGTVGPAPVNEVTCSIGKNLTSTFSAEVHYDVYNGLLSFIQRKRLGRGLGLSFSEQTTTTDAGTTPRGSTYLAGLTYTF